MCDCENCKYKLSYMKSQSNTSEWAKKKKEERLAQGLCFRCGKNPVDVINGEKITLCKECNEKQKLTQKKYEHKKAMLKKTMK